MCQRTLGVLIPKTNEWKIKKTCCLKLISSSGLSFLQIRFNREYKSQEDENMGKAIFIQNLNLVRKYHAAYLRGEISFDMGIFENHDWVWKSDLYFCLFTHQAILYVRILISYIRAHCTRTLYIVDKDWNSTSRLSRKCIV